MSMEVAMTRIRARNTFGSTIARAGFIRADVAKAAGVSVRTIDSLASPPAKRREAGTREVTAWKIARGYATLTHTTPEAAFEVLFEAVEEEPLGQPTAAPIPA